MAKEVNQLKTSEALFAKQKCFCEKDVDARWAKKNDEKHYGYKNHINADEKTKLITKYSVTNAALHDSTQIKNLVDKTDKKVYADSAYRSEDIEEFLKKHNIQSCIQEKGYKNKPLTKQQQKLNNGSL